VAAKVLRNVSDFCRVCSCTAMFSFWHVTRGTTAYGQISNHDFHHRIKSIHLQHNALLASYQIYHRVQRQAQWFCTASEPMHLPSSYLK